MWLKRMICSLPGLIPPATIDPASTPGQGGFPAGRACRSRSDHHGGVGSVFETVAAELSRSGVSDVERAVFGTDDPWAIDRIIGRFREARFGRHRPPACSTAPPSDASWACPWPPAAGLCSRPIRTDGRNDSWRRCWPSRRISTRWVPLRPSPGRARPPPGAASEPGDGRDMARRSRHERGQEAAGPACAAGGRAWPVRSRSAVTAGSRRARPSPPSSPRGGPLSRAAQPALRLRARRRVGAAGSTSSPAAPLRYGTAPATTSWSLPIPTGRPATPPARRGRLVAVYDWDSLAR